MTTATAFLAIATEVQDDIATVSNFSEGFGYALDGSKEILEGPGKLEDMLREPADAIDLPDPLVSVLGLIPFGIGTAIKTIDKIGETTAEVIDQQADIMGALDDSWSIPRSLVSAVGGVNTALGASTKAASFVNGQMEEEAVRLGESLGGQTIEVGFELADRMAEYEATAQEWFDTRDALLAPFQTASAAFEDALNELEALLPSTDLLGDAADAVLAVMQPIKNAAEDFEKAICIDFTITPEVVIPGIPAITITPAIPATYVTILGKKIQVTPAIPAVITPAVPETVIPAQTVDICKAITDAQSGFDAIIETVVKNALALIGVDFGAIADDLLAELLGPLQPIFDAIDKLKDAAGQIIEKLIGKLEPLVDGIADMIDALDNATTVASLFDNTIEGDKASGPDDKADVLTGLDGEDAIFGLSGNDNITGGGGDFLFGGLGDDTLTSNGDEVYGGAGKDILKGSSLADRMDGGSGNDKLYGGGGEDMLVGGGGKDKLFGGGNSDLIYGGSGDDRVKAGSGKDEVFGGNGNDKLFGKGGADKLHGEDGDDRLVGGNGNDTFTGGAGNDEMYGGRGRDTFNIDAGADTMIGGSDEDRFIFNSESDKGNVIKDYQNGIDKLFAVGYVADDLTIQASGTNTTVFSDDWSVTFEGIDAGVITTDDFIFV